MEDYLLGVDLVHRANENGFISVYKKNADGTLECIEGRGVDRFYDKEILRTMAYFNIPEWQINCTVIDKGIYHHCYKGIYYRYISNWCNKGIDVWELSTSQNIEIANVFTFDAAYSRIDECLSLFKDLMIKYKR